MIHIGELSDEELASFLLADNWLQEGIIAKPWSEQPETLKDTWLCTAKIVRRAFKFFTKQTSLG